ncbi:NAD(P)/FAD-dependent oxidoreductase [Natronomonas gomsonensis]|jgi:NADH dehydrogenase|uniref:NAD(P)/FAD-dependent oxidoreductase n=1 Tax=Natronomonas gomsonensis TaxID=1046043 RepID=UPI0020CA3C39|nr:NAD(P)/FAD-dependent oxidoreductase [Natronomonas gomsonensis]MCY4729370.1 NAD(P)/FAD-dependent oxidoreductase [Natronomonas gomsonensis]
MTDDVVVLGSGYAGTGAVKRLESELDGEADITWVSDVDHHLVLHESHRCIRNPEVQEKITFSVSEIKSPSTRFVQGRVEGIDTEDRQITLDDDSTIDYDYLLVGFGSQTAFFGIDGLEEHSLTLKTLDDALEIHEAITEAAREASRNDPAQVIVGGAGLSGIQSAGEIAEFRDKHRAPLDIHLVEGLDNVFPNNDPVVQAKLRKLLEEKDVEIHTGEFIGEVDEETVYVGDETELDYDVLLWTGGITGQDAAETAEVDKDERSNRIESASNFQTSDERIFALGDAALIDQPGQEQPAPPTAQAAWQAAEVAGENIARTIRGQPLKEWEYDDKGTLISVGSKAVAHDVKGLPVDTFGGPAAKALKKTVAARWIKTVNGFADAAKAFPDM